MTTITECAGTSRVLADGFHFYWLLRQNLKNLQKLQSQTNPARNNLCRAADPLSKFRLLHTGDLPGVYVIAASRSQPVKISIVDPCVVYIGETVGQTLCKRLYQLDRSLKGNPAHSGGLTLGKKGFDGKKLWLAIRSFPLVHGMTGKVAEARRSAQIRSLERTLLHEYVLKNDAYPAGNSK